jgi:hypothetical protein
LAVRAKNDSSSDAVPVVLSVVRSVVTRFCVRR